jgi:hypothetical protein
MIISSNAGGPDSMIAWATPVKTQNPAIKVPRIRAVHRIQLADGSSIWFIFDIFLLPTLSPF